MALEVLGAGFGRTGTLSLRTALEILGLRCYHMLEVPKHPGHADLWAAAARGDSVGWEALLAGFAAAVDWPAAAFWKEILASNPAVRVILTVRDPLAWYTSFRYTILERLQGPPPRSSPLRDIYHVGRRVILERTFAGRAGDLDRAISVFNAHNRAVVDSVAPSKLLLYRISDGWAPLCRFLRLPMPEVPFPHVNRRSSFRRRYASSAGR